MEVPRGFTRCDECGGEGGFYDDSMTVLGIPGGLVPSHRCEKCDGSGLVPTEKLREEAQAALAEFYGQECATDPGAVDAVLTTVAARLTKEDSNA